MTRNIKRILFGCLAALFLPWGVLGLAFLFSDTYPGNFMDARIARAMVEQKEEGTINLAEATPFEWDEVCWIEEIAVESNVENLEAALGISLRGLRRMRRGGFDMTTRQSVIFLMDGEFAADFIVPSGLRLPMPTDALAYEGIWRMARISREEARWAVRPDGELAPVAEE